MTLDWPTLLPLIFAGLMGLAILIYVMLDGFDLGIGILFAAADDAEKDTMIAAIGPFWDANETWLVLAVGLLLVAFPAAHGVILTALYLPVFAAAGRAHPARRRLRFPRQGADPPQDAAGTGSSSPARSSPRWRRATCSASMCSASTSSARRHGVRRAGGALPCRRLCGDGRGLADLQDRRRAAEEGGALAARGAGADRARHGRGLAGHAVRQSRASSTNGSSCPRCSICRRCRSCRPCCSLACGGRPSICPSRTTAMRCCRS